MLIKIPKRSDVKEHEVTDESLFYQRRQFIEKGVKALAGASLLSSGLMPVNNSAQAAILKPDLEFTKNSAFKVNDSLNTFEQATTYNNFYEFGTDKTDPAKYAKNFRTTPWSISVEGETNKPGVFNLEDFLAPYALEERIYRFRCVEAWSMVIPWVGFPLAEMIKKLEPNSNAKYVEFTTLHDPERMPGQKRGVLDWPYVEGLRMDEAMHPLSLMVVGMYGKILPNQNGAPLRLMVPWKYGFKNIKSIVKIRFTRSQPRTTWALIAPDEYGFYANVNPQVDHPRWSQKRERKLGDFLKKPTLMFNGYEDEVASLYSGLDLRRNF